MKTPNDYLEAAKTRDLADRLQQSGYDVTIDPGDGLDLAAAKGGRRIAYEVKARSDLGASEDLTRDLREMAIRKGYDEFRLVVVNPPRDVRVCVAGLERLLEEHLRDAVPDELQVVSSNTLVDDVADIEIDTLEVTQEGVHVAGSGVVETTLVYGGGESSDVISGRMDFPFDFDVILDRELHLEDVKRIAVDTTGFYERRTDGSSLLLTNAAGPRQ